MLVERGDRDVVRSVAINTGARFFPSRLPPAGDTFDRHRHPGDPVGSRRDIPRAHYLKLIEPVSASVREKLTALDPQAALAVKPAIAEVTGRIRSEARDASADYAETKTHMEALYRS